MYCPKKSKNFICYFFRIHFSLDALMLKFWVENYPDRVSWLISLRIWHFPGKILISTQNLTFSWQNAKFCKWWTFPDKIVTKCSYFVIILSESVHFCQILLNLLFHMWKILAVTCPYISTSEPLLVVTGAESGFFWAFLVCLSVLTCV